MRVHDLMQPKVTTVLETSNCEEVAGLMSRLSLRHLPVLDRAGALVGIITDRDIRQRLFAPDLWSRDRRLPLAVHLRRIPAHSLMSAPVITIEASAEVAEAAYRMRARKVGALVVMEGTRVAGILTETDLLSYLWKEQVGEPGFGIIGRAMAG
jgi:CBS domain-containing protein